jgi:hypothetical protein
LPCCKGIEMCDGMLRFQSFVRHDSSYDDNFPTLVSRRTWKVGTMTRIKLWWSKEGWPEHDSTAHHFFMRVIVPTFQVLLLTSVGKLSS